METKLKEIIEKEEIKLKSNISAIEKINILYNLISIMNRNGDKTIIYKYIKIFVDNYVQVVKTENYGYDIINHNKIEYLIQFISYEEQVSILNYSINVMTRELPDYNKEWLITRKHIAVINKIISAKDFLYFPKAFLLIISINIYRLFVSLSLFFIAVYILLLPSPFKSFEVFDITYNDYSKNFYINHFLNTLTLFADIDNEFKIKSNIWIGAILMVIGKILFGLFIINFIYRKLSDKIAEK